MRLEVIHAGNFKLDGGAMFGVVPKSIWNTLNPADENNMCNWAMRCLYIEDGNRQILIDTGIGNKQSEKFYKHYYLNGGYELIKSLKQKNIDPNAITDVILTHLHFDHCGGAVWYNQSTERLETTFPNAQYWIHPKHWNHAVNPNAREKASFLKENFEPILAHKQLEFINEDLIFNDHISFIEANGHTESMICPRINYKNRNIVYMADMIPSVAHLPINYVMGYDIRPLDVMKEKEQFLKSALLNNDILFFEHDLINECCTLHQTERGIRAEHIFELNSI